MDEPYHRAREMRERELAANASDPSARNSHLRLAALHASKANRVRLLAERNRPIEASLTQTRVATR